MSYKHKVVEISTYGISIEEALEVALKKAEKDEWELVSVTSGTRYMPMQGDTQTFMLFFKKPERIYI